MKVWPIARVVLLVTVVGMAAVGFFLRGEAQAGIFFGSGAAMLALLLGEIRYRLRELGHGRRGRRSFSLGWLSALNTARILAEVR